MYDDLERKASEKQQTQGGACPELPSSAEAQIPQKDLKRIWGVTHQED